MKRVRLSVLILFALFVSAGASCRGQRHVATVSVVSVHAVLSAVQDGERALVCGKDTAPAPPACVPPETHREIAGYLVTAFDLDAQIARTVRAVPPGGILPENVGPLLSQVVALIDKIMRAIPASPQKDHIAAQIGGVQ